jgi:hypothetical protein
MTWSIVRGQCDVNLSPGSLPRYYNIHRDSMTLTLTVTCELQCMPLTASPDSRRGHSDGVDNDYDTCVV